MLEPTLGFWAALAGQLAVDGAIGGVAALTVNWLLRLRKGSWKAL